jgi:peptide/nickel transport system substrate-binding protein
MNLAKSPLVVGVLPIVLLIAGCSFGTGPAASSSKTLIVDTSFNFDSKSMDPPFASGTTAFIALSQTYETLVRPNISDSSKLDPVLAQSWTASPDGLRVTFNLRHDAHFSDGTPVTSDDVVFSLMRLKYIAAVGSYAMDGLTAAASDPYTVVVTADKPDVFITSQFVFADTGIVNSKVVKANGGNASPDAAKTDSATTFLSQSSAGSGPYQLVSADPKVQIVLKANPNYWGQNKPVYSKVVINNETASSQLLDVQQGQNTIALDLSPQQATTVDKSKVNVISQPSLETMTLMLNASTALSPSTSNLMIRQAVRYGIDYKALLELAGLGAVQAPGMLPSGIPGSLALDQAPTRDVTKAKSLVAQSGVTNPAFTLSYESDLSLNGLSLGDLAQLIQANLKDVGITVKLNPVASAVLKPQWFAGKLAAFLYPLGGDTLDASGQVKYFANGLVSKWMGWTKGLDPTSDALASQILANADPSQEAGLISQEQTATDNFAVFIPLFISPLEMVASKSIGGLNLNPLGVFQVAALT